ncbi:class I SAM-dependent methyltransferase [Spirosoma sp. BT702]|uniref:Class I SAM-dependent methyltransferase n=1 Tax=Spirosoma profusum TaxID=2771354 RepID=A0A927AQK6_9BACT|nr:class I SAM-dependent methyltransferase [Spirosoma profusum]MBD2700723.1 class I SAM-dependent methyltransferase [Spirosoma profusum]
MIAAYFRYLSRARDEHSLHSPFLFSLYTQIIRAKQAPHPFFASVQQLRKILRNSRQFITVTDLGAGSRVNTSRQRSIGDIARNSQKPDRFGRLLFRLIQRFEAKIILDLGTSFGLTTAYLAEATKSSGGQVTTFEGCPEIASIARQNFEQLSIENVNVVIGNLDETLTSHVAATQPVDFVFFDANHRYEPTVRYFETCLTKIHNDTVFVFDDIHWSDEMEQAWAYIKAHPSVSVTIDLFWVGLVFFRREQPRQDFVLRF